MWKGDTVNREIACHNVEGHTNEMFFIRLTSLAVERLSWTSRRCDSPQPEKLHYGSSSSLEENNSWSKAKKYPHSLSGLFILFRPLSAPSWEESIDMRTLFVPHNLDGFRSVGYKFYFLFLVLLCMRSHEMPSYTPSQQLLWAKSIPLFIHTQWKYQMFNDRTVSRWEHGLMMFKTHTMLSRERRCSPSNLPCGVALWLRNVIHPGDYFIYQLGTARSLITSQSTLSPRTH